MASGARIADIPQKGKIIYPDLHVRHSFGEPPKQRWRRDWYERSSAKNPMGLPNEIAMHLESGTWPNYRLYFARLDSLLCSKAAGYIRVNMRKTYCGTTELYLQLSTKREYLSTPSLLCIPSYSEILRGRRGGLN